MLFAVAVRNLSRHRRRTALTLTALVIGVTGMVGIRGFLNGFQRSIVQGVVEGQLGAVQVHRAGYAANVLSAPLSLDFADERSLRDRVLGVEGVTALAPRLTFGALLSTPDPDPGKDAPPGRSAFVLMTGVEAPAERQVAPRRLEWLQDGAMFDGDDGPWLFLTIEVAHTLELSLIPEGQPTPDEREWPALLASDREGSLNGEAVLLRGTFVFGLPGDKRLGLLPLKTAQRLVRMEGRVTEYALSVRSLADAPRVRDALKAALGPSFEVQTWDEVVPFVDDMLQTQDFVLSLVTGIFLVVVLLGIVNSMLMSVLERVREIGTMLAVGMRRRQVAALFLLEGAVLGAAGASCGLLLGVALVEWLRLRGVELPLPGTTAPSVIRPFIEPWFLARLLALAVLGAVAAGLWPASRASRLAPVEALQHV